MLLDREDLPQGLRHVLWGSAVHQGSLPQPHAPQGLRRRDPRRGGSGEMFPFLVVPRPQVLPMQVATRGLAQEPPELFRGREDSAHGLPEGASDGAVPGGEVVGGEEREVGFPRPGRGMGRLGQDRPGGHAAQLPVELQLLVDLQKAEDMLGAIGDPAGVEPFLPGVGDPPGPGPEEEEVPPVLGGGQRAAQIPGIRYGEHEHERPVKEWSALRGHRATRR